MATTTKKAPPAQAPEDVQLVGELFAIVLAGLIETHRAQQALGLALREAEKIPNVVPIARGKLTRAIDECAKVLDEATRAVRKLGGDDAARQLSNFVAGFKGPTGQKVSGDDVGAIVLRPTQSPELGFMPVGVIMAGGARLGAQAVARVGIRRAAAMAVGFGRTASVRVRNAGKIAKASAGKLFPTVAPAITAGVTWFAAAGAFRLAAPGARHVLGAVPWYVWVGLAYFWFGRKSAA